MLTKDNFKRILELATARIKDNGVENYSTADQILYEKMMEHLNDIYLKENR